MEERRPVVTLLAEFGTRDPCAGVVDEHIEDLFNEGPRHVKGK